MKYRQRLYYIWLLITKFIEHSSVIKHLSKFWLIWLSFAMLFLITFIHYCIPIPDFTHISWSIIKWIIYILVFLIITLFVIRPMNTVYGMMGTSGSIRVFFTNFLIITAIFTFIYYFGFFHNAKVSYDVNQPHIFYNYHKTLTTNKKDTIAERRDTIILINLINQDGIILRDTIEQIQVAKINYQNITFFQTFRNTILTTLMQEPTDFFAIAATHNEAMDNGENNLDGSKAATFHYLLIIQILISWIFFGVFISILYNKFRYES